MLPGTWLLADWQTEIDGALGPGPFEQGTGFIQYVEDGWMSAILSAGNRVRLDAPVLAMAESSDIAAVARRYVSYAGTWSVDGDQVLHTVELSLFPNWIGTTLVRVHVVPSDSHTSTPLPGTSPASTRRWPFES